MTDPGVAQTAVAAGADAIGLIFHPPSACCLELEQAAAICRAPGVGPFVSTVAVLVNPSAERVTAIIERVNPSHLQFHGDEPADFCAAFGKPYIKALRVADDADAAGTDWAERAARYPSAHGILLDTHVHNAYGGTGATFDWRLARHDGNDGNDKPLILAGGLTPENVAEAVALVAPYAVDVRSGVETGGRKDAEKIRRFCRQAGAHGA